MSLYKRIARWIHWKTLSKKDRAFLAHLCGAFLGPDAWEVQQFNKESRK